MWVCQDVSGPSSEHVCHSPNPSPSFLFCCSPRDAETDGAAFQLNVLYFSLSPTVPHVYCRLDIHSAMGCMSEPRIVQLRLRISWVSILHIRMCVSLCVQTLSIRKLYYFSGRLLIGLQHCLNDLQ